MKNLKRFEDVNEGKSDKTKILYVFGDDDYAVIEWKELSKEKQEKAIKKAEGKKMYEFSDGCFIKILEFGKIDPKFIDFIRDEIMDYDSSKHQDFFLI
jgi:hypothetical protein